MDINYHRSFFYVTPILHRTKTCGAEIEGGIIESSNGDSPYSTEVDHCPECDWYMHPRIIKGGPLVGSKDILELIEKIKSLENRKLYRQLNSFALNL